MPKLSIKLYSKDFKDLEIPLLENSLECEVLWAPRASGGIALLYVSLWVSIVELTYSWLILDQPLAILNAESVAEHHSSSATLQSLSGSSTVPWGKNFIGSQILEMEKKQVILSGIWQILFGNQRCSN